MGAFYIFMILNAKAQHREGFGNLFAPSRLCVKNCVLIQIMVLCAV
jgi:hypothetical protein